MEASEDAPQPPKRHAAAQTPADVSDLQLTCGSCREASDAFVYFWSMETGCAFPSTGLEAWHCFMLAEATKAGAGAVAMSSAAPAGGTQAVAGASAAPEACAEPSDLHT